MFGVERIAFGTIREFCKHPERICAEHDEDVLWSVAMFEWVENIYRHRSEDRLWSYEEKLVELVNSGMRRFVYYSEEHNTDRDCSFLHAAFSIVNKGCHEGPCRNPTLVKKVNKLPDKLGQALEGHHQFQQQDYDKEMLLKPQ